MVEMSEQMTFETPLTQLLGMKYPIILAGMASISNHELAAAVSNAGGSDLLLLLPAT